MRNDPLNHIWTLQKSFNRNFVDFDNLDSTKRQEQTKEYVLHMISEVNSLLEGVNWKMHHKKDSVEVNRSDILIEWIDAFKYWLSIGLLWDFTPQEFLEAFDEKSRLVEQRYLQEFSDYSDKEIVICDIDGVLGDYPRTFLEYVEGREREFNHDFKIDKDNVTNLNLYEYLEGKVPSDRLKMYKHTYRSTGEIRTEKVVKDAQKFLKTLRNQGDYIVLLTSRPFDQYKSLYLDTYVWLVQNGLEFDMLLSDSKKRDKVLKILSTSTVKFLIDDDPKIITGLNGIDKLKRMYLMDRPYNQNFSDSSGKVIRVKNFDDILEKELIE